MSHPLSPASPEAPSPARNPFTAHPASVGETYAEHFAMSMSFSWRLLAAAFAAFIHALLPFLFEKTASGIIRELHGRMVTHRCVKIPQDGTQG